MHYHVRTTHRSGHTSDPGPFTTREAAEEHKALMEKFARWGYIPTAPQAIHGCDDMLCLLAEIARTADEDADYEATATMTDDEAGAWFKQRMATLSYDIGER